MVWPRQAPGTEPALDVEGKPVYRYAIVGMIVSDTPVPEFEGRPEIFLDGLSMNVLRNLSVVPSRQPAFTTGDASDVLVSLADL